MKSKWHRFAPLGLYLSIIAALGAVAIYIIQREWSLPLQISLGLVVIGLATFAFLDPEQVRAALTGRQARYGSNAVVLSLAFLGIVVVINYLVYTNSKRWDLTENQQFTLAPETLDTLAGLPQPVSVDAYYTNRYAASQVETARGLLDQYAFHSGGKLNYQFIDPEGDMLKAQQANVTRDGTVVLAMADRSEQVTLVSEKELTGALIRLLNPEKPVIYFLAGHGEADPDQAGEQTYYQAKKALESKNYVVKKLNLLSENALPQDAQVVVIAGPQIPLSENEISQLSTFLSSGGALIVMNEPLPFTKIGSSTDLLAEYLNQNWGISLGKDIVVDLTSSQPFIPFAARYGSHAITQKMRGVTTFFPSARSVTLSNDSPGPSRVEIVFTADQSWGETDLEALSNSAQTGETPQIAPDESVDLLGPLSLVIAAQDQTTTARLVVIGDVNFATDAYFSQYGNGDLFINSVDWAAEQEELINLTPKEEITRVIVPPKPVTMNLILFGTVFLLPGLVLIGGIGVWIQRRRRG